MKKTTLLLLILLINFKVFPKDIYVSTSGNDNALGTEANPLKTIQKATTIAGPGDHVYIKSGTYSGNVTVTINGTANNWVTYDAYPGDELNVILNNAIFYIKASYVRVSGIKVQNGNNGFHVAGPNINNIETSNNHTYNTKSSGIIAWGVPWPNDPSGYNHIQDLRILNNKVQKACNGGYNECITLANGIVGFEISGNEIYDGGDPTNGGEGIDIKAGVSNGTINDNYAHHLTRRGIYLDAAGIQGYGIPTVNDVLATTNHNKPNTTILVYPNPATNQISIKSEENVLAISIFDLSGKQIISIEDNIDQIDISKLQKGVYNLQIQLENTTTSKLLIIK